MATKYLVKNWATMSRQTGRPAPANAKATNCAVSTLSEMMPQQSEIPPLGAHRGLKAHGMRAPRLYRRDFWS